MTSSKSIHLNIHSPYANSEAKGEKPTQLFFIELINSTSCLILVYLFHLAYQTKRFFPSKTVIFFVYAKSIVCQLSVCLSVCLSEAIHMRTKVSQV